MFQLPLLAVVNQIHAGIHFAITHLCVRPHIRAPLLGVVTDEVVGLARKLVEAFDLWCWLGTHQFHPKDGRWAGFELRLDEGRQRVRWLCRSALGRCLAQHQHGFGSPRQKQRVALAPRKELYLSAGLPYVRLKAERQFAVVFHQMLLGCLRNVPGSIPGRFRQWSRSKPKAYQHQKDRSSKDTAEMNLAVHRSPPVCRSLATPATTCLAELLLSALLTTTNLLKE